MIRARLAVLAVVLGALTACGGGAPPGPTGTLTLVLTAGPVCPVERVPPDPACAPRPVSGAVVAVFEGDRELVRGTSDAAGRLSFSLPHGRYTVHPLPPESRFPIPPGDQLVDVGAVPVELALEYDTGIR